MVKGKYNIKTTFLGDPCCTHFVVIVGLPIVTCALHETNWALIVAWCTPIYPATIQFDFVSYTLHFS